jgi:chromosomal replication initiator protein
MPIESTEVHMVPVETGDTAFHMKHLEPEQPIEMHRLTVRAVAKVVCARFGVCEVEIASERRDVNVTTPRQIIYFLSRKLTGQSLKQIGRVIHRDHTSVLHGANKIAAVAHGEPYMAALLEDFERELTGTFS